MSGTPAENRGYRRRLGLMIVALVASVVILLAALMNEVHAQDTAEPAEDTDAPPKEEASKKPRPVAGALPTSPLVVPVFPRREVKKDPSDDSEAQRPVGEALRDSYIIMEDGSVMTMGDWVKGGLTKNQVGAGMSDYQNRLFLGQVARSMAGVDETMVNRSLVSVGPLVPFEPARISEPLKMIEGILRMFMPGRDGYSWNPATSGGGFDRRRATEGGAAVLFENQFSQAVNQTAAEFQETGTMLNMLKDYKKKQGKD